MGSVISEKCDMKLENGILGTAKDKKDREYTKKVLLLVVRAYACCKMTHTLQKSHFVSVVHELYINQGGKQAP